MPESRSDKRKERYAEAIALGFSPAEARALRDRSGDNIQKAFTAERRRISRKPASERTAAESFRLTRIQQRDIRADQIRLQARLDARRARWQQFSEWSSKGVGFPPSALRRIRAYNKAAGLSRDDGFGFRRYYYEYVERLDPEEVSELADRADSGTRYLANKPLVPGRPNLRTQENPPAGKKSSAA